MYEEKSLHIEEGRAHKLYRLAIGLLMLIAFCYQQVYAQDVATLQKEATSITAAEAEAPSPTPVSSTNFYTSKDSLWWHNFDVQHAQLLGSPIKQVRMEALQNLVFFAAHYGSQGRFEKVVPKLLDVYAFSRSEANRLMALATLHAIDDERSMRHLAGYVQTERPGRLRHCTLAALVDHLEKNKSR